MYINQCYRSGPCLFAEQRKVPKEGFWDFYDTGSRSFIFLDCRLHQKFYTASLLEIEDAEKYHSPIGRQSYETPDLQLSDQNGRWMTRSDDPECYYQLPYEEPRHCSICDIVCDIRDDERYLHDDGTCPFPESAPQLQYWKIEDNDRSCGDFLHPLLFANIESINRKRRKAAKAHIWNYLKEPRWMHALIDSGQRMIDVWERNYKPVTFYFRSFETVVLYLKTAPRQVRENQTLAQHVRRNLEHSPSFKQLLTGPNQDYERRMLLKLDRFIEVGRW